jgi:nitrite reductase/ring-hydroxylating ferredoxin subunit
MIVLPVFAFLLPVACQKDYEGRVPYVPVNINVVVSSHIDLNVPGNYIYFPNHGFAGIILMCIDNINHTYYAFDAACTYDISNNCSLLKEGAIEGVIATCPCCGSKFNLFGGGYILNGPAIEPLKPYRVQVLDAGARLRIYN